MGIENLRDCRSKKIKNKIGNFIVAENGRLQKHDEKIERIHAMGIN